MQIDRRSFTSSLLAAAAATIAPPVRAADAARQPARNVVLVHGLFADEPFNRAK